MPLLAAGPGVLPAAAAAPCPPRALAPCQRGGSRCLGRVRRCLLPHAPCGRGPFNCSSPRPCPIRCPRCLAPRCPAPPAAVPPSAWVAEPAQLQAGGSGCPQLRRTVGVPGRGCASWLGTAAAAHRAVPCTHNPGASAFPVLLGEFSPLGNPSAPPWIPHGLPPLAAVVPWLCNLLPAARMAPEPSCLTGSCSC